MYPRYSDERHRYQHQSHLSGQIGGLQGLQGSGTMPSQLQIPANAEPAFWDSLPDLSRYPKPHQLSSRGRKCSLSPEVPLYKAARRHRFPSFASTTSSNGCPQPSSGSIYDLREHRKASSVESKSKISPHSRANSDLKNIYTAPQLDTQLFPRSHSKRFSETDRHSSVSTPSTTSSPSIISDRDLLPSQQTGRLKGQLSRSGALRRKKTGFFNTQKDSQTTTIEVEYLPAIFPTMRTPPPGNTTGLESAWDIASATNGTHPSRKSNHLRNRTTVHMTNAKAPRDTSQSAPPRPIYSRKLLPPSPYEPLPVALESGTRAVHFSSRATYAPSLRTHSDSGHSASSAEVLDIDELMAPEEGKDEVVETALQEAATNARLFSPHDVGSMVKERRREVGDFTPRYEMNAAFKFPGAREGGEGVRLGVERVSMLDKVEADADTGPTPTKKYRRKKSTSAMGAILHSLPFGKKRRGKKGKEHERKGHARKVSIGETWVGKMKGVLSRG
jgi:hypothetical protein